MSQYSDRWRKDGYLVLPGVFDAGQVAALRAIGESAFEQWKRDSRPEVEPGDYAYGPTAWTLMHLNHPKYHQPSNGNAPTNSLPTLLNAIADPRLIAVVRELLRDDPLFGQANYYINPY